MCTLTIHWGNEIFIGFNRDEKKDRPFETAIEHRKQESTWYLAPEDPVSGGTWIAVNEHGLFFALLNLNSANSALSLRGLSSRGLVIPQLVTLRSQEEVRYKMESGVFDTTAPFRLICLNTLAFNSKIAFEFVKGKDAFCQKVRTQLHELNLPRMWTSFGGVGGDAAVQPFRNELFQNFLGNSSSKTESSAEFTAECQRAFHFERVVGREEHSPFMLRSDAYTTSVSLIRINKLGLSWKHEAFPNAGFEASRSKSTELRLEFKLKNEVVSSKSATCST
jgi:hypothetical protein